MRRKIQTTRDKIDGKCDWAIKMIVHPSIHSIKYSIKVCRPRKDLCEKSARYPEVQEGTVVTIFGDRYGLLVELVIVATWNQIQVRKVDIFVSNSVEFLTQYKILSTIQECQ